MDALAFRRQLTYKYGETQIGLSPTYGTGPYFDSGDTAWMLAATALVLFMTLPGLALFFGGMVCHSQLLKIISFFF